MKLRLLCALLFLPVAVFAAALPIEFNGVVVAGGKTSVALLNPNTGSAKWVAVGGKFDSYIVTSYTPDPKGADVVILTQSGGTQTELLVLKNSYIVETPHVRDDREGEETDAQVDAVYDNIHKITDAASQYFLEHGVTTVTFDQLPEAITKSIVPVAGEKYNGMVLKPGGIFIFELPLGRRLQVDVPK
jgi:hypothetical protein